MEADIARSLPDLALIVRRDGVILSCVGGNAMRGLDSEQEIPGRNIAALWPERCTAMVSVSGYLIGSQKSNQMPLPPKAELQMWYQYYFSTESGRLG